MKPYLLSLALSAVTLSAAATPSYEDLIPAPNEMRIVEGAFHLSANTTIAYNDDSLRPAADYLASLLEPATGFHFMVKKGKGDIILKFNKKSQNGYSLTSTPNQLKIKGDYRGIISGISTLMQLLPNDIESRTPVTTDWYVPALSIDDKPKYEWRGLMLDCSRHFFSKQEVEQLLDLMALYKLNKFHWHLTDDQGWRIEIKRYPRLTERGAWREFNNQDMQCLQRAAEEDNADLMLQEDKLVKGTKYDRAGYETSQGVIHEIGTTYYGGFYTQDDIHEVVEYARVRGIDVIPEIDMPGHMLAAVSNYNGVSCFDETGWGSSFSSPVCPGKDSALEFCKNIYEEILPLFPYEYVHIGGDEVEKTNWKKCPDCQKRIKSLGLQNEEQLQSWFIHQMEEFFIAHGKKMIGWDEITEGGLSKTSTVMWWRGWNEEVPPMVAAQGNDMIYSPNTCLYLDNDQDAFSIENIYNFNPLVGEMSDTKHVKGYQGNIWCEQVPSMNHLYYMANPRLLALSEIAWGTNTSNNLSNFKRRMTAQYARLRAKNIPYHLPELQGMYNINAFVGESDITVSCADENAKIWYTTDGNIPTAEQMNGYKEGKGGNIQLLPTAKVVKDDITCVQAKLRMTETTDVVFRTQAAPLPGETYGKAGEIVRTHFQKDTFTSSKDNPSASTLKGGLHTVWHEFPGGNCNGISAAPINATYETADVCIPDGVTGNIGLITTGYINLTEDGIYTFALFCDDGADLVIDDMMIVDNNREQYPTELICQKAFNKGLHPMILRYFDHNGGLLRLRVFSPSGRLLSPADLYYHK